MKLAKDRIMSTQNAWDEYVAKFNTTPQNATQLMRFSQRNPHCESLNFSTSRNIFYMHKNPTNISTVKKTKKQTLKPKPKAIYKSYNSRKTTPYTLYSSESSEESHSISSLSYESPIVQTPQILKHRRNYKHIQINQQNVFKSAANQLSISRPQINHKSATRFAISRRTTNTQQNQYNQTDNIYNLLDKLPTPPPPPPPLLQSNTTLSEPDAAVYSFAECTTLTNGMKPKLAKLVDAAVFLYVEFPGLATISFGEFVRRDADIKTKQFPGIKSKTWLFGIDTNSVGGFYEFNSRGNAQHYVDNYLIGVANKLGVEVTYKLFLKTNTNNASI